jgi:chromosome segregation protein
LQGELLEADGTLTVGALRGETTPVSQKSELRRLKNDLTRLDRQIRDDEQKLEALLASLAETDGELEAAKARLQQASEHHTQAKADAADRQRELDRLTAESKAIEAETDERSRLLQETRTQLEQAQLEFAALEGQTYAAKEHESALETKLADCEERRIAADHAKNAERLEFAKQEQRLQALRDSHERQFDDQRQFTLQTEEAERRLHQVVGDRRRIAIHILNTNSRVVEISREKNSLRARRGELHKEENARREERRRASEQVHALDLNVRELRQQMEALAQRIEEEYQLRLADVVASGASAYQLYLEELRKAAGENPNAAPPAEPQFEDVREELESRVARLRRQLKLMGSVNTESLRDLEELERRFTQLSEQLADLVEAKRTLEEILRRISDESKRRFNETFQLIRGHFKELFRKFFGGGEGDIVLENDDVLECGIDIVARPPGKELRSISLLSGGERTLTAIALLLAIFRSRPSPFCILDEVDAALDEANVDRFAAVVREFKERTQFVMITHSKRSMAAADVLYGVTMEESGVSKRLSVKFEDVAEDGQIRTRVAA